MKGRILEAARRIFGEYGFHGTTTRMIAQEVGIDISTLYYHWGEKADLYEAVVLDIYEDLRRKLSEVERAVQGKPLARRMEIALDTMTEYLFEHPEISNLILFRYFAKTRHASPLDFRVPELMGNIAYSMGLVADKKHMPVDARMKMLAVMNTIHSFVSGQNFFMPLLDIDRETYLPQVKETLKFLLIPPFLDLAGRIKVKKAGEKKAGEIGAGNDRS
ncbi:MAG: TetR/AcrR family transcriptional regulator [Deltaproteobacteria bacterium]|nr:TetR/AcrR family transcriptional regulator [Deltaproteobacteria bacterium]